METTEARRRIVIIPVPLTTFVALLDALPLEDRLMSRHVNQVNLCLFTIHGTEIVVVRGEGT